MSWFDSCNVCYWVVQGLLLLQVSCLNYEVRLSLYNLSHWHDFSQELIKLNRLLERSEPEVRASCNEKNFSNTGVFQERIQKVLIISSLALTLVVLWPLHLRRRSTLRWSRQAWANPTPWHSAEDHSRLPDHELLHSEIHYSVPRTQAQLLYRTASKYPLSVWPIWTNSSAKTSKLNEFKEDRKSPSQPSSGELFQVKLGKDISNIPIVSPQDMCNISLSRAASSTALASSLLNLSQQLGRVNGLLSSDEDAPNVNNMQQRHRRKAINILGTTHQEILSNSSRSSSADSAHKQLQRLVPNKPGCNSRDEISSLQLSDDDSLLVAEKERRTAWGPA